MVGWIRVKEVKIPSAIDTTNKSRGNSIHIFKNSNNPGAQEVKVIRGSKEAKGSIYHEELSEGIFDEINNIIDANNLLSESASNFLLGEPVYYRIYAERQHVRSNDEILYTLAKTAINEIYAPFLFWLIKLSPEKLSILINQGLKDFKHPMIHAIFRLAFLLGDDVIEKVSAHLQKRFGGLAQPPEAFWTFGKMKNRSDKDLRLVALKKSKETKIKLQSGSELKIKEFIENPLLAKKELSSCCMAVFKGDKSLKTVCRSLDVLVYGLEIMDKHDKFTNTFLDAVP